MKMAAPGLSCPDQRTLRVAVPERSQQTAVRFEADNIVKEQRFIGPACSPDMPSVSVGGNRKHYRFRNSARSEEQAIFEGVFICSKISGLHSQHDQTCTIKDYNYYINKNN
ncbi:hypothetical protein KUCAC02_007790 [Chaenocephalus aceratus]|uniref:Uncharacterized protein n=1 Tax=Chaenocephalus aceratus TaxID=36190 RepID=A0ACB9X6L5_CHAAC|nr:hypothetical protein KUCAC02_007790 [Chaenocephalus aceratus]